MLRLRVWAERAGMLVLALCLCGCIPGDSRVDEEKDPHFQRARSLVNSQDYKGAAAEFEMALENNPRSAAAHFELACLYDSKINDCAAAIYHYQRHLQLQADSDRAQTIRERIRFCKQELANGEFAPPNTQNLQRQVDRLTGENAALKQQVAALQHAALVHTVADQPPGAGAARPAENLQRDASPAPSHPRVHLVKERETITSIAAQYGLSAKALLSANPSVNPRRLRVGQSLNLP